MSDQDRVLGQEAEGRVLAAVLMGLLCVSAEALASVEEVRGLEQSSGSGEAGKTLAEAFTFPTPPRHNGGLLLEAGWIRGQ